MKLRGATRFGGVSYYRLIASVFAGEPVQVGDTWGSNSHERDRLLTRYAGLRRRSLTPAERLLRQAESEDHK